MTTRVKVFENSTVRAVGRSKGHLKFAEHFHSRRELDARDFAVEKANHTIALEALRVQKREADAREIATLVQILQLDPEVIGLSIPLVRDAEVRITNWVEDVTGDESEEHEYEV
jgi:hypothetical protein